MTMLAQFAAAGGGVLPSYIEDVFSTYLYTGTGAAQTITNGIDLAGEGGLVWVKNRVGTSGHYLGDTNRGMGNLLSTNTINPQSGVYGWVANNDGFTVDGNGAQVGNSVSWTFRKQPKFFDVVTYTGTGGSQTINHNLGSVPGCIIVKCTSDAEDWYVYHRSLNNNSNDPYFLVLNTTAAQDTGGGIWRTPTSTQFTVQYPNAGGRTYVAYLWAHDAGGFGLSGSENVVSCGGFTANGSGVANVNVGYEPQLVLYKLASTTGPWLLMDSMRGMPDLSSDLTTSNTTLFPNTSAAESGYDRFWATSTGFYLANGTASATYIYIAIRRGPMKVPTDGTKVFAPAFEGNVPDGQTPITRSTTGVVDMAMRSYRPGGVWNGSQVWSRLQGDNYFNGTANTDVEGGGTANSWAFMNGWLNSAATSTITSQVDWMFRRAPSFFDEVCDTGTGVARTVAHNLAAVPELIIRKNRDGTPRNWTVACTYLPNGFSDYLLLNSDTNVGTNSTYWNATAPTTSVFSVGTNITNTASVSYVSYLFATCPGVSKVGSYTGTGTTQAINCGFTTGARFVLIKRTDSTGDWYVWDSARGIVAGNDPYLLLNSTAAEVTSTDYVDTSATGFELTSTAPAAINASGGSFIFLAIS